MIRSTLIAVSRWTNALAIDAVAAAIVWQAIFAKSFRGSWPSPIESVTMAITLWLVYTADHLLDARHLDLAKPASFRHRIHQMHRSRFVFIWIAVTLVDASLIIGWLSDSLIRWGLVVATVVLTYGARVHFGGGRGWCQPAKEVEVGMIFAFGVGLLAWDHGPSVQLALATVLAAVLFAANCLLVADWESEFDLRQSFDSVAISRPKSVRGIAPAAMMAVLFVTASWALGWTPSLFTASLALSGSLTALLAWGRLAWGRLAPRDPALPRGLAADAMLWSPAIFCWAL